MVVEAIGTEAHGLYKEAQHIEEVSPNMVANVKQLAVTKTPSNYEIDQYCGSRLNADERELFMKGLSWYLEANKLKLQ